MTDERFTITQDFEEHHRQIRDNGHIIMGCFLEPQAEPIVKLLNELSEENEQLKQTIYRLKQNIDELMQLNVEEDLLKENEQLKQALLFFVDVANAECSSNWLEDMEKDCKRLFNCTYEEAKGKYGDYEW